MKTMNLIYLGVNIDHVATIRQVRGTAYPSVLAAALEAEAGGADGITVHLREDRRHIQEADVWELKNNIKTRLNLEMAASNEMVAFAEKLKPAYCCLVPEKRQELTTEGGLNVVRYQSELRMVCSRLQTADIQVSLFIDPESNQIEAAKACGANIIEIHTGTYANSKSSRKNLLHAVQHAAHYAFNLGLQVNAGHGLHLQNVEPIAAIPEITELNIGHAIIARALFCGLSEAVAEMKQAMQKGAIAI